MAGGRFCGVPETALRFVARVRFRLLSCCQPEVLLCLVSPLRRRGYAWPAPSSELPPAPSCHPVAGKPDAPSACAPRAGDFRARPRSGGMGGCNSRGSTYPATEEEDDTGSALHRGINFMPKRAPPRRPPRATCQGPSAAPQPMPTTPLFTQLTRWRTLSGSPQRAADKSLVASIDTGPARRDQRGLWQVWCAAWPRLPDRPDCQAPPPPPFLPGPALQTSTATAPSCATS